MKTAESAVLPVDLRTGDDSGLAASARRQPTLWWRLEAQQPGVRQIGYELQRARDRQFRNDLQTSGGPTAGSLVWTSWPWQPLESREVVWCRVRVWTDRGLSEWSEPVRIEGSLYEPEDWRGRPITPPFNHRRAESAPVPLLRRSFELTKSHASARLYVTAQGLHEVWINGQRVDDALLEPGWSDYRRRLLFAVHDVTSMLQLGENVVAARVGDGWWRGNLTWMDRRAVYGDTTALLAQLEVTYSDGSVEVIPTDDTWRGATGELLSADIYNGSVSDLAAEPTGWQRPGFDDTDWTGAVTLSLPPGLEQRAMPPVRVVQTFPVVPRPMGDGHLAVDCGQNLTGFLRFTVRAEQTGTIEVRHAEVLEPDGGLHVTALRGAKATDTYHIPEGRAVLEPSFTYHGFRYAQITVTAGVTVEQTEVCVVSSDLPEIGSFACSNEQLNQLFENIRWSQRGNFLAIPTDCPQRDERLGWTGDIQVFAPTACANFDARTFLESWLIDLASEQRVDGYVPSTVPNVIQGHEFEYGGVGWGDAATLVPWALYRAYGDTTVLARQFASMRAWADWGLSRRSPDGVWVGDFHLGDWLDPGARPETPELATTDRDYIASCYLALSASLVSRAAAVLQFRDVAATYRRHSEEVAAATWRHWSGAALTTQTGCAMAIEFGIAPPEARAKVGQALADLVERSWGRIATGFLGTPLVLPALTRTGQIDAAYRLLLNEAAPGWLYQVRNGATTMWERWDAIEPDGKIHSGAMESGGGSCMISFNHYAYGSVGEWLYRSLAGIGPAKPGYATIDFAPQPGGGITWAEAGVETPFGLAKIRWQIADSQMSVSLAIPPGAQARFTAPEGWLLATGARILDLESGAHALELIGHPSI